MDNYAKSVDNYADILHFMEVIITAIISPILVYLFIDWHSKRKENKKPSKSSMPNLNKLIKDIQEIADKPFK